MSESKNEVHLDTTAAVNNLIDRAKKFLNDPKNENKDDLGQWWRRLTAIKETPECDTCSTVPTLTEMGGYAVFEADLTFTYICNSCWTNIVLLRPENVEVKDRAIATSIVTGLIPFELKKRMELGHVTAMDSRFTWDLNTATHVFVYPRNPTYSMQDVTMPPKMAPCVDIPCKPLPSDQKQCGGCSQVYKAVRVRI